MNAKQVADTILQQIKMTAGQTAMWSWAFQKPQFGTDKKTKNHFLIFTVSGFLHKGKVQVMLMGNDTYTINLLNRDWTVKSHREMIYCDEVGVAIDEMVEHPGDQKKYEKMVNKAKYRF